MHNSSTHQSPTDPENGFLIGEELHRLTLYKWRYAFEALGFDDWQVHELMFLTWLRATSRLPD